jgi:hypothetical protein
MSGACQAGYPEAALAGSTTDGEYRSSRTQCSQCSLWQEVFAFNPTIRVSGLPAIRQLHRLGHGEGASKDQLLSFRIDEVSDFPNLEQLLAAGADHLPIFLHAYAGPICSFRLLGFQNPQH